MFGDSIGFVGLGNMGLPMSARLAAAGFEVVAFDIDPGARERAARNQGITAAPALVDVAAHARAVILMLPNSEIVGRVLLDDGLLDALAPATMLIDMSSSNATETRALAERAGRRGVRFVDAPVSGGVSGARAGSLTIMVGGSEDDLTGCRELFQALGSDLIRVGDVGAGHAVKALNNLLSATSLLASAEVLAAARRFGLDPEVVLKAINRSTGRSWSTEQKLPRFVLPESFDSGFALQLMVKDIQMATGLARAMGTPALLGEATVRLWSEAAKDLSESADHTEIAKWVADRGDDDTSQMSE